MRVLALGLCLVSVAASQDFYGRRFRGGDTPEIQANTPYDGRFVFIRLRYGGSPDRLRQGYGGPPELQAEADGLRDGGFRRGRGAPWSHDYPRADVHFMKILKEITLLAPRMDGSNILSLDDPELFNFPVAYMSEPGFWMPGEREVEGLRAYLRKGGFVIFDDFRGGDWYNLEEQMRRVLPDGRFVVLDGTHAIFHSFFEIDSPLDFIPPYGGEAPSFYGMFEDNDPNKRLMVIANRDNDLGEYWEFSDTGWVPIDLSNEAYKFGVNYVVYAMTH